MSKAGQTVGQSRDAAGQTPQPGDPWYVRPGSLPWEPRTDDRRALSVSERTTVFDRPMPVIEQVEVEPEVVTALGPLPVQWTWDLVHCRLLCMHAIASQLPKVQVPATYRSFLGALQPQEATPRRRVLTDADTKRFDWTMSRVDSWPDIDRIVLKGYMSGHKLEDISAATIAWARRYGGDGLQRSSVYKRYRTDTALMAAEWSDLGELIDVDTRECWLERARHKGTNRR